MIENFNTTHKDSAPNHDPNPVDYSITKPLSGYLFLIMILAVVLLIGVSFLIGQSGSSEGWSSFFLNLSTEIAGAIFILVVVEQRITGILPGISSTQIKAYAKVLVKTLKVQRMTVYISRPAVEKEIESKSHKGFIFKGKHGLGKTTMLHYLIKDKVDELLRSPSKAHIPVLVSLHETESEDIKSAVKKSIQNHLHFKDKTIERLLSKGRLLCIFDELDEIVVSNSIIQKLKDFHLLHINNPMIISTTLLEANQFAGFELEVYEIPPFSNIEGEKIKRIQERLTKVINVL